ncbi:MAG: hypothetical protein R3D99_11310 [Altererythrobacter sp.]
MKWKLAIAGAAMVATMPLAAKSVPPQDRCGHAEGADQFRMALAMATANRDADLLRPLVDPQVHLDFGGGTGWDLLRERLDDPDYDLWDELDKVQRLGCGMFSEERGGEMYMPYYWGVDPGTDDPYFTYFVIGSGIPLHHGPAANSPLVDRLNWDIVTLIDDGMQKPGDFAHVQFASGRKGFVAWKHLRSLVDYRMIVGRRDGDWRIVTFIAGD